MKFRSLSLMLLLSGILSGCAVPPNTCECDMDLVLKERGPPDAVQEYSSFNYTFTKWTYYSQKAEYKFVLNPLGCEVTSDIRTHR